jgi:hypothetical protein
MDFNKIKVVFKLAITAEYERSLEADELDLLSELFYSCGSEVQRNELREITYRVTEEIECR